MESILSSLAFVDMYLGEKATYLADVPGEDKLIPAPKEWSRELDKFRRQCDDMFAEQGLEFSIKFGGVAYRAGTLESMTERVYVLRRFPATVPVLGTMGIHPEHVKLMLTPKLTGLIIIAGAFGSGKTTTASALVVERLKQFGGVAVTIEDPPEMPLEGPHGQGQCYQRWVQHGGFGQAVRQAARWAPSLIFLGEVRDSECAREALHASINGRLIVCTVHADSVISAIERLYSFAKADSEGTDSASLLANGLAGVFHQSLSSGAKRHVKVEALWLGADATGAKSTIRARRWEQLGTEISVQFNRLVLGRGAPPK